MPEPKNVVCLVVDRLHSGYLGAYGNSWIATPNIDRLAAESFLLDRGYVDSPGRKRGGQKKGTFYLFLTVSAQGGRIGACREPLEPAVRIGVTMC